MPSHLRLQSSFEEPISANAIYQTSPTSPPAKKQKMSLTQTYFIASTARSKLGREAAKPDHNLRRLVGSANLLDSLMLELAQAEREQEQWFNASIRNSSKPDQPRHVQWVDTIVEDEDESDSDSDLSDDEEEGIYHFPQSAGIETAPARIPSPTNVEDEDEDEEMNDDDEEEFEDLQLTRTPSKHSPPELTHEDESDSDDEYMPSSPEDTALPLSEKQRAAITTTAFYDVQSQRQQQQQQHHDFAMQQQQTLVAAC